MQVIIVEKVLDLEFWLYKTEKYTIYVYIKFLGTLLVSSTKWKMAAHTKKILHQTEKVVRQIFIFLLYLVFVYWATQAVLKFFDEPTTTKVNFTWNLISNPIGKVYTL